LDVEKKFLPLFSFSSGTASSPKTLDGKIDTALSIIDTHFLFLSLSLEIHCLYGMGPDASFFLDEIEEIFLILLPARKGFLFSPLHEGVL